MVAVTSMFGFESNEGLVDRCRGRNRVIGVPHRTCISNCVFGRFGLGEAGRAGIRRGNGTLIDGAREIEVQC